MSAAEQYPNLAAVAYHRGGVRLSAELRVEAADALERLNRRCDGCRHWHDSSPERSDDFTHGRCLEFGHTTYPYHACNAWSACGCHLTPAHDKEKS